MYKKINYGAFKEEIKKLGRLRLKHRDRVRYHLNKINHHQDQIKVLEDETIPEVEKELNKYLEYAKG
ncbi:MAG: hypothetical protein ACTSU7_00095 [Candidatus Heimdallarchaeaceae archaeon]